MNPTDQIAAEATGRVCRKRGKLIYSEVEAIIKSAIEKATEIAVRETSDYIMAKLRQEPRAAHAREKPNETTHYRDSTNQYWIRRDTVRIPAYHDPEYLKKHPQLRPPEPAHASGWQCPKCGLVNSPEIKICSCTVPAHASEQGAELLEVCQRILNSGELRFDLENALATALSQPPTPATAESFENDATIAHQKATTPATASETNRVELRGKHIDIEYFGKPDSASTGKAEKLRKALLPVKISLASAQRAVDAISDGYDPALADQVTKFLADSAPSGGGEWTVFDAEEDGWGIREGDKEIMSRLPKQQADRIADAHNTALRDYGNDTKRLDLMETQGGQFAKIKGKSWRESADIHAAMLETGEQKVDWLRAAAGPTEEQQTGEQTK